MDKMPLVTVVMALYRPNLTWLQEELISIHEQTYKNFQVYVCNDDPEDKYPYEIFFKKYLQEIPFKIFYNSANLGSNKTFEKLTTLVHTPYISYCDQDDKWLPYKLSSLIELLKSKDATLAFSDVYVIDEKSKIISHSITDVRPRQVLYAGKDIVPHLLAKNFVTGCTMMMRTEIARKAVPFPTIFFHDWWLAAVAALSGVIKLSDKPLMYYRLYADNQSKPLANIHSKSDYFYKYISQYQQFITLLSQRFVGDKRIQPYLEWGEKRSFYFQHPAWNTAIYLWKHRYWAPATIRFELILPFIPSAVFSLFLRKIQSS